MRRSLRRISTATLGLLLGIGIAPVPAQAGRNVTTPINVSCPSGQQMVAVQFRLTAVPRWQKITVETEISRLVRDHVTWTADTDMVGTADYDIALDAPLNGNPAVAYISADPWTGTFEATGATCRAAAAPTVTAQGSSCDAPPQVVVRVTNPNNVRIVYTVSGPGPRKDVSVGGGRTEETTFGPITRGLNYQVTVTDGKNRITAIATLNQCAEASPSASASPGAAPSGSPSASVGASVSPSVSTSPTLRPSASASPSALPLVDPVATATEEPIVNLPIPFQEGKRVQVGKQGVAVMGGVVLALLGAFALAWIFVLRPGRRSRIADMDDTQEFSD